MHILNHRLKIAIFETSDDSQLQYILYYLESIPSSNPSSIPVLSTSTSHKMPYSAVRLPVVDVGSFFEQPDINTKDSYLPHKKAAKDLLSAFEHEGMAYLLFTGSSLDKLNAAVDPAFTESSRFFSRPLPEKQTATPGPLPKGVTRGYLGTGVESGASEFESKEAFSWSSDWDSSLTPPQNALESPNVWPHSSTGESVDQRMKHAFDSLFTFMGDVMLRLVTSLAMSWPSHREPLPDLHAHCRRGNSISLLRALHYHASPPTPSSTTGSCAHTDWGFATLIAQQLGSAPALQVRRNDEWVDVAPMRDTLVVNCSDFLSMLTDGHLHSPLHRVILTPTERLSFVYFQYPGFDTTVPALSAQGNRATSDLSLLNYQGMTGDGTPAHKIATSFGELIALKWQQVSR